MTGVHVKGWSFSAHSRSSYQCDKYRGHSERGWPKIVFGSLHSFKPPRLSVWLILNGRENELFALFATVCSSWIHLNAGTSRRSLLLPEGDTSRSYIQAANEMVSRTLAIPIIICFISCFCEVVKPQKVFALRNP